MALAVASSTARAGGNAVTATTASFSPATGTVLVAISHANSNSGASVTEVTTNSGTGLTWQRAAFANFGAGGQPGGVFIDVAVVGTGASMTVTATTTNNNSVAGDRYTSLRVWVVTGANTADPIGASNKNGSTTNNLTTTGFTTLGASSLGFCGGTDWVAPAGSIVSSDMGSNGDAFTSSAVLNGYGGWKNLSTLGSSATFNLDSPGSSASQWTWASCEIQAAPVLATSRLFLPF